jgi:glycerophosphoryl diester phosphodiesterase
MRRLIQAGADGIITDNPALLISIIDELNQN